VNQFYSKQVSTTISKNQTRDKGILKAVIYHHTLLQSYQLKPSTQILQQHVDSLLIKLSDRRLRSIYYNLLGKDFRKHFDAIVKRHRRRIYWGAQSGKDNLTTEELKSHRWLKEEGIKSASFLNDFFDLRAFYEEILRRTKFYGEVYPNSVL
jgi:hypothetical protein